MQEKIIASSNHLQVGDFTHTRMRLNPFYIATEHFEAGALRRLCANTRTIGMKCNFSKK